MPRKARKVAEPEDLQSFLNSIPQEIEGASNDKVMDKIMEVIDVEDAVHNLIEEVEEEAVEEEDEEEEEEFDEDKYFIDDEGNCYIKTTPKIQKAVQKKLKEAADKKAKLKRAAKSPNKTINLRPATSPPKGNASKAAPISVRPARSATKAAVAPIQQEAVESSRVTRGRAKLQPKTIKEESTDLQRELEELVDDPDINSVVSHLEDYAVDTSVLGGIEQLNQDEVYEFEDQGPEPEAEDDSSKQDAVLTEKQVTQKSAKVQAKGDSGTTYTCSKCPYTANKRFLMTRHCRSHDEEPSFKCSICDRAFRAKAGLVNHMNTHTGTKPHKCKSCDSAFVTSGELIRHTRYKHTKEKPHKCSECNYASVELTKLRRHITCHTGERPYQCPDCTYASQDMFKLKRHMVVHTGERKYQCDICKARFTQSNSLKSHKLIHTVVDKPSFQCTFCPSTCGRKADLRIHIKHMHTATKPLKCRRCGQELPDRYQYKLHVKSHEGEKCYRCELCPYASVTKRHLDSHMLVHLDEKPFTCDLCPQTFRQRQLLRRHVNLMHNDNYEPPKPREKVHQCPSCPRTFTHKGNLIRHMEVHDDSVNAREQKKRLKLGRDLRILPDGKLIDLNDGNALGDDREEECYDLADIEPDEEELPPEPEPATRKTVTRSQPVIINKHAMKSGTYSKKPVIINKQLRSQSKTNTFHIKEEQDTSDFTVQLQDDDGQVMVVELINGAEEVVVKREPGGNPNISASNCFGFEEDGEYEEYIDQDNEVEAESQEFLQLMDMIEQDV
ncbi:hypothetical protein KR074_011036 [Drosophila pseudoananassae]|nr:hypothetical protein KR074_011036 [Drosophila pseudoananassae]